MSTIATIPGAGNGHLVFRDGALWVTAKAARQIYRVDLDGTLERVAGSGERGEADGPALQATLARPNGVALSPDGRFLYWNDHLGDAQNNYAAGPSVLRRLEFSR